MHLHAEGLFLVLLHLLHPLLLDFGPIVQRPKQGLVRSRSDAVHHCHLRALYLFHQDTSILMREEILKHGQAIIYGADLAPIVGEGLEIVDQCVLEAALIIERVSLDHSDLRVGRAVVSPYQGFGQFERLSAITFLSNT